MVRAPSETDFTRKVMEVLKGNFPGFSQKHADRFSTGVPDITHTMSGFTWWLELKTVPLATYEDFKWIVKHPKNKLQFTDMRTLDAASHGRAWYIFKSADGAVSYARPGAFTEVRDKKVTTMINPQVVLEVLKRILYEGR